MKGVIISFPKVILTNLIYNENFTRKIIPYIKAEYFDDKNEQILFEIINDFIKKYNSLPSMEAVHIDLSNRSKIDEKQFETCKDILGSLVYDPNTNFEWLYNETEKFVRKRAFHIALLKCIQIFESNDEKFEWGAAPEIMQTAIGTSFDNSIGNDFFDDAESRYDQYHQEENKVSFDIDILNQITKGGVSKKTLNILMAGPGVGKSFAMCHMASHNLMDGKNVLYITLEMSEEKIQQRIEENLLDVEFDALMFMPKDVYLRRIDNIHKKTVGKLKVKEYPTKQAGSAHFRALLRELKMKQNFIPDIIYVDYLNICISSTIKNNNLYEYVKTIGEEIRGLGVEFDVPIITATQFNREGYTSSDPGMENTSESFGTNFTADLIIAIVTSKELEKDNQLMFVQIKNRYNAVDKPKSFLVGSNKAKMQLYNVGNLVQSKMSMPKQQREEILKQDLDFNLEKSVFDEF